MRCDVVFRATILPVGSSSRVTELLSYNRASYSVNYSALYHMNRGKKRTTGCYVSVDVFSEPTEADNFVRGINLCHPPGKSPRLLVIDGPWAMIFVPFLSSSISQHPWQHKPAFVCTSSVLMHAYYTKNYHVDTMLILKVYASCHASKYATTDGTLTAHPHRPVPRTPK